MKLILCGLVFILSISILFSCKKDDPGPSSAEGKWTYTTPDSKMAVDFELVKSVNGYKIQNAKLTVDGVVTEAVVMPDEIPSQSFSALRFSANDAKLIYGYYLLFSSSVIASDFSKIEVASSEYTFPWGTTKKLSAIVIVRS